MKPTRKPKIRPKNTASSTASSSTHWDGVAKWYDDLVGREGSEFHQKVIFPNVLRLMGDLKGKKILDIACGQGAFCRALAEKGAGVTGVDASKELVRMARERGPETIRYFIGDARENSPLEKDFDFVTCLLAIQNIDQLSPAMTNFAARLKERGKLILTMMHPCFRNPKQTHWGWDEEAQVQFRRVDRYLLPRKEPIFTHPGEKTGQYTWSFHRPLHTYFRAIKGTGMLVEAMEEWESHKHSDSGPRAPAENAARREIPMFLTIVAVKIM
jgi:2-polyprenyl-3-methyl-5-hydroxy-6-metoxy-1,4-benzoquinol methylase